jgi:5'-nucleotidase
MKPFCWAVLALASIFAVAGCAPAEVTPPPEIPRLEEVPSLSEAPRDRKVITLVATNDIHGHLERLPDFGGYLRILRRLRAGDGAVVVVDAGDMWQGTIASNLDEGASGVAAFEALGYDAVTIGNHEFDYGPAGERATPEDAEDDPFGALRARMAEADFPFLAANLRAREGEDPLDWPNVRPSLMLDPAGVKVGLIGVTTEDTLTTTIAANVRTLAVEPLAETIAAQATELREAGAQVVVVLAHAGGECEAAEGEEGTAVPPDSCHGEILEVVQALPPGLVDLVAAGHTHQRLITEVRETTIVEAGALATAFARIDFVFEEGELVERIVHPIREICADARRGLEDCEPGEYEGAQVAPDARVLAAVVPAFERAREKVAERLGETRAAALVERSYREESPLGNLLVDWMHELRPDADVAILNAGGVRADLPEGPLTYGALYEAFPFDNRLAVVRLTGEQLRTLVAANLRTDGGILLGSGFTVKAACDDGELKVRILDRRGRPIPDRARLTALTSDYLATTPAFGHVDREAISIEDAPPMRDLIAHHLREEGGSIDPASAFDPEEPRWELPGPRPISCE